MQEHQTCLTHMPHLASCSLNDLLKTLPAYVCLESPVDSLCPSLPFAPERALNTQNTQYRHPRRMPARSYCVYVAGCESPSVSQPASAEATHMSNLSSIHSLGDSSAPENDQNFPVQARQGMIQRSLLSV